MAGRGLCEHYYLFANCPHCLISMLRRTIRRLQLKLEDEQAARQEAEAEVLYLQARVRQLQPCGSEGAAQAMQQSKAA